MIDKNTDYVLPIEREDLKPKKKKWLTSVIGIVVSIFLVLGSLFIFAPNLMMPKNILKGTWELTVNPDRIAEDDSKLKESDRTFYEFSKIDADGKGTWKSYNNGCVETGEFTIFKKSGKTYINLGGEDLEYKLKGNKNFNKAKFTLIYPEQKDPSTGQVFPASTYVMEQSPNPEYDKNTYNEYNTDSKILGEWKSNERALQYFTEAIPYNQTVTFNDNGIMNIRYETEGLNILSYYAYTVKDNKLTFSLVTDLKTKYTVEYNIDEAGNLKFVDTTTTQSPIFGDAFFGEYTYYRPDKISESTEPETIE